MLTRFLALCSRVAPPRSPHWDEDTTHEMLDRAEREAFMKWRRELATSVMHRARSAEHCHCCGR